MKERSENKILVDRSLIPIEKNFEIFLITYNSIFPFSLSFLFFLFFFTMLQANNLAERRAEFVVTILDKKAVSFIDFVLHNPPRNAVITGN